MASFQLTSHQPDICIKEKDKREAVNDLEDLEVVEETPLEGVGAEEEDEIVNNSPEERVVEVNKGGKAMTKAVETSQQGGQGAFQVVLSKSVQKRARQKEKRLIGANDSGNSKSASISNTATKQNDEVMGRRRLKESKGQKGDNGRKEGALLEVKLNEEKCEEAIVKCSPNGDWKGSYSTNYNGWSRILVLWNSARCEVTIEKNFTHFICSNVKTNSTTFGVTFIYASNNYAERASMWEKIQRETSGCQGSSLFTRDFNSVLSRNEKRNGAMVRDRDMQDLQNFVTQKRLVDLEQGGYFYSWNNNNKNHENRVWCKLDRAMGNESWFDEFQDAKAFFSPPGISDHSPILISWGARETYKKHFRYCRFWEELDNYKESVEGCWRTSRPCKNLFLLQGVLAGRLKDLMPNIINQAQGAFVKGRSIVGNVSVAQQLMAGYGRKHISERIAWKIDLRKAYDTV
ncbi:hypothetical protein QQ045_002379 [Rhodiola kirilowii]